MNHIFYQTKTNFANTGDALINHALIDALRKYGAVHANCSSSVPAEFLDALGVRAEERMQSDSEFAFIQSVIRCALKRQKTGEHTYVFSGPGDMYGGGLRLVIRNLASALIFPVFRLFGVRIVRIGRSVGPISTLMALSERIRCIFLTHYFVRDTQSLQRCKDNGMKKVKLSPDLSWIYDAEHTACVNHTNTVMVNLRNSIFDDTDEAFVEATIEKCVDVLSEINKCIKGQMKILVAYQVAKDARFGKAVYERLKSTYDVTYIGHQMRLDELETYYGAVDYHISNRMHSLLAGYKYGSLPIALIDTRNHMKIAATFEDCGLHELMVDIYDERTAENVAGICARREDLLKKVFQCEKRQQEAIYKTLDYIFT